MFNWNAGLSMAQLLSSAPACSYKCEYKCSYECSYKCLYLKYFSKSSGECFYGYSFAPLIMYLNTTTIVHIDAQKNVYQTRWPALVGRLPEIFAVTKIKHEILFLVK